MKNECCKSNTELVTVKYIAPYGIYKHGPAERIIHAKTKFQNIEIIDSGIIGKILILDNSLQSCTTDEFLYHEALVQPACIFHGSPKKVLVLGGGEGATIREVLKWKTVKKVVMIDIDEETVNLCRKHIPEMSQGSFEDKRTELIIADAYEYVDKFKDGEFDIVISDLTEPTEDGLSAKLFTKEYFEKCKRIMKKDGYFVMHSGPVSPTELGHLHLKMANTLKNVMGNVAHYVSYIPSFGSSWGFVMASENKFKNIVKPEKIDKLIAKKIKGNLFMIDGTALLGLLNPPKYIREAVMGEKSMYSLKELPKFKHIEIKEELGYKYLKE